MPVVNFKIWVIFNDDYSILIFIVQSENPSYSGAKSDSEYSKQYFYALHFVYQLQGREIAQAFFYTILFAN